MISIVIVGYNSKKYLPDCLSSIFNSVHKNFRVIFVDNLSSDDSLSYVRKNFPQVVTLEAKSNDGFSGGNNLGIKKAIELKSDYIFLLNPDTVIDRECLEALNQSLNKNTILQPLVLLHKNGKKTDFINTSGNYLNYLGFSYVGGYNQPAENALEQKIPLASGACALIPSSVFLKIGYFDEKFFMYHEDTDLFWRARRAGYDILLTPQAKIWHKYSFGRNKKKLFYAERNRLLFLIRNFSLKYLLLILPLFLLNEVLMLFYSLITGNSHFYHNSLLVSRSD